MVYSAKKSKIHIFTSMYRYVTCRNYKSGFLLVSFSHTFSIIYHYATLHKPFAVDIFYKYQSSSGITPGNTLLLISGVFLDVRNLFRHSCYVWCPYKGKMRFSDSQNRTSTQLHAMYNVNETVFIKVLSLSMHRNQYYAGWNALIVTHQRKQSCGTRCHCICIVSVNTATRLYLLLRLSLVVSNVTRAFSVAWQENITLLHHFQPI